MTQTTCKTIDLALQGGGAHGAFTWGVIDGLLEDGRIGIEALSGTSAGAMNAVVYADGFVEDGVKGARAALERFWRAVSDLARWSPLKPTVWDAFFGSESLEHSPAYLAYDLMSRVVSPYMTNPFDINSLRDLVEQEVDFERVRRCERTKIFVSATNVETGLVRVFSGEELSLDAVMASACLPQLFKAVEIDGMPYWDGGFAGNPVLFPFFEVDTASDIVVVQINPLRREGTPRTARQILDRMNEINFNSSLLKEFRAIDFVTRLLDEGVLDPAEYRRLYMHVITSDDYLKSYGASSKFNTSWDFLCELRDQGRAAARAWLKEHFEALGHRNSVDLRELYQGTSREDRQAAF